VASDVITLPGGRRLRWYEFGDRGGPPVLYTTGTPVSGLGGAWYDQAARASGLRWISLDKPGYGGSGYHRDRSLASWADDLAALAGHLGLDRFALAGESGGAPFTLEIALIRPPWPFPLGEVTTPVHLWHGTRDTNAPIANSRHLARELPDATLHTSDSADHEIGRDRSEEITSVIASCVT
jgi:pimeloyl-ACP methyl ester carboxylesterase